MDKFTELLPPAKNLSSDIQGKVIRTWDTARIEGKWEYEDMDSIPFTLLIPDTKISLIEHTLAVTDIALKSAEVLKKSYSGIKINDDYLLAGALLHDVGKLLEYEKRANGIVQSRCGKFLRHPFSGANLAYKIGLPDEVVHIIATHSKEGDSGFRSVESIIVHHADFINFESLKVMVNK